MQLLEKITFDRIWEKVRVRMGGCVDPATVRETVKVVRQIIDGEEKVKARRQVRR